MSKIIILGAGISGLATAWFLKRSLGSTAQVTLVEKKHRTGGWIETLQTENFLFEQGPRSCRTKGAGKSSLALIEALGLQDLVITPDPHAKIRYLYHENGLQKLPRSLWELPFNSTTRGWLAALWRDYRAPKGLEEDETIHSFFSRRIGPLWTENFIDPMVSGIYAGDINRLSLKSCFPLFDEWEKKHGGLLRGALSHRSLSKEETSPFIQKMRDTSLFSFREGMETLPRALTSHLKENLLLGESISQLTFSNEKVMVELSQGKVLHGDILISTLPSFVLGGLLKNYSSLSKKITSLPYASVTSINIGFNQKLLPYEGFGYLIPSRYRLPVLGCVWDSSVFPQQNDGSQTRLTMMMGGSHHPEVEQMSDSELMDNVQQVLQQHLKIQVQPEIIQIRRASQAIPQFELGHSVWKKEVVEEIKKVSPRLFLSGSYWTGVSINDCIAQAEEIALQVATILSSLDNI